MSSDTKEAGGVESAIERVLPVLEQCEAIMKTQPDATPATVAAQLRVMADAVEAGTIPLGDVVCLWNAPGATFVHVATRGLSPVVIASMFVFHARHIVNDDDAFTELVAAHLVQSPTPCAIGTVENPTQH